MKNLASFNVNRTSLAVAAGKYNMKVTAPVNIKQTACFSMPKERMVEKCNKVLVFQLEINELKKLKLKRGNLTS